MPTVENWPMFARPGAHATVSLAILIIAAELFLVLRKTNEPVSPFLWEREKAEKNTTASTGSPIGVDSGVEWRFSFQIRLE
jgi:hypothetical protein